MGVSHLDSLTVCGAAKEYRDAEYALTRLIEKHGGTAPLDEDAQAAIRHAFNVKESAKNILFASITSWEKKGGQA